MNSEDLGPVLVFSLFIVGFFAYKIAGRLFESMDKDAERSEPSRASDVQADVQATVREATAPLQRRVDELEAEVRTLRERLGREGVENEENSLASSSEDASEGRLLSEPEWDDQPEEETASRSRGSSVRT